MEIVYEKKIVIEYDVQSWCCDAFEDFVKGNRVIFFDKKNCQFKDLKDNILLVCPFCEEDLGFEE